MSSKVFVVIIICRSIKSKREQKICESPEGILKQIGIYGFKISEVKKKKESLG